MQLTKTKNKQKKLRSAKRNQNFAYRFAYLVLFLLHGITALSFYFILNPLLWILRKH
ncbi:hypothetical protein LEP1GSC123_0687 [Leptospira borgpetersenii str. 200701203]|uniref:Uncharacterized protein n=1 Tax=Leptospira borgpetersenii str. 200701203 TaxID=1193007 RepID=M3HT42_LEPBO|nr:hypothetical protein LEP1GSC123_0687 [Leptospira borgpetersenii str. 200701203]